VRFDLTQFRLLLTKHKCLTEFTGGSGHGHSTKAVFCAVQNVIHNWAVFYAREEDVSSVLRQTQLLIVSHNETAHTFLASSAVNIEHNNRLSGILAHKKTQYIQEIFKKILCVLNQQISYADIAYGPIQS
jgi:hypothetical protein